MLIKLLGVYYDGSTPVFGNSYISNLTEISPGDILADKNGDPVTFGIVAVPYNSEPPDIDLLPGDTKLWYNIYTDTIWSKTRKLDTTIVTSDLGFGGSAGGAMTKAVYDTNDDGTVNSADSLKNGVAFITGADVAAHTGNTTIHSTRNDLMVATNVVWSSQKISDQLALKSNTDHVHQPFDGVHSAGTPSYGFVPLPPEQNSYLVLHTDGTWSPAILSVDMLEDAVIEYPETGDLFIKYADNWGNVRLQTDAAIHITFDQINSTLNFNFAPEGATEHTMLMLVGTEWKPMTLLQAGDVEIGIDDLYGTITVGTSSDALINSLIY